MGFLNKIKDSLANRAAEAIAASLTVLLAWIAYQIGPIVLPAIEAGATKRILLGLLVASVALNVIFLLIVWLSNKKSPLKLKYRIYWDSEKNPYCPSCKTPLASYGNYQIQGLGYYCGPCKKHFRLADASGNNVEPARVLSEL